MEGDTLSSCLLLWIRSFDGVGHPTALDHLTDGLALWTILRQVDPDYFAGQLPEPDVNHSTEWTRKWQNLKHIEKQLFLYYRDICNGQDRRVHRGPDLKAIAAEASHPELEHLLMTIIRAAMASPAANQMMARRLMGLGKETAMVIAGELRTMEEAEDEVESPSRDGSAYQSEAELPGDTPRANGTRRREPSPNGGMYTDPLLEREEELLQAQATIGKLQASQLAAQRQLQDLRQDKERLQEAFDTYRHEIESKGRKTGSDDAFKMLQRQAENDRAYIDGLEGQLQSSRTAVEKYERQMQRVKEESELNQKLRDDLQMLRAENEDLQQKIKANENLKKKIHTLQEQEKANVMLRDNLKTANERLEELDHFKQVLAQLEKEILEKKGLIRNQEYQINELVTTRKHAEYDNRVLLQKLQDARDRHDRDHEAMQELRQRLQDSNLDDSTTASAEDDLRPAPATPQPQLHLERNDESKHLAERLALVEQQLEAADARLKQAAERNAVLEEQARDPAHDHAVREYESTIAGLRKDLALASSTTSPASRGPTPAASPDVAVLQRENQLMTTAWYDLAGRLTSNGVSLDRRRQEPRSWIGKQRALVGPRGGVI